MKIQTEIANEILANFGISRPSRNYERWHKGDHFLLDEFDEVLFESRYIFIIDWRAWFKEEMETIVSRLSDFGITLDVDFDEDGNEGVISCGGKSERIKYCPNDDDDFEDVIRALGRISPNQVEFRSSPFNEGSDTWIFAVNGPDEWKEVDEIAPEVMNHFFRKLNL